MCDRGEFICQQPEKLVVSMMYPSVAPPYIENPIQKASKSVPNYKINHEVI